MRYGPLDSSQSPRFTGVRTFMRLPYVESLEDVDVAVIGVPTDDAVSFKSGARFGPEAIRSASALLRPYNPLLRVDVTEHLSMIDHGDCADGARLSRGDAASGSRLISSRCTAPA